MKLPYHLLNVFGRDESPFTGNPLCVFEQARLDDALMQTLARQFNLSETVFLQPSDDADARIRIFTPDHELPFAGHPTLGSASLVARLQSRAQGPAPIRLETRAGVVEVRLAGPVCTLTRPAYTSLPFTSPLDELAAALGLSVDDIGSNALKGGPLWVDTGSEQLIVPLQSADAVTRARPQHGRLAAIAGGARRPTAYVFAPVTDGHLLARFFFSVGGVMLEDPATGSATANLGGWWRAHHARNPWRCEIRQGEQIARPSTLLLEVDAGGTISVGGRVWYLGRGEITC